MVFKIKAYLITWTTYGSWLPGDRRRWVDKHDSEIKQPISKLQCHAENVMKENAVTLGPAERRLSLMQLSRLVNLSNGGYMRCLLCQIIYILWLPQKSMSLIR